MSQYSQYGTYHDPVGSQPNQPSGYAYQRNTPATQAYTNPATPQTYNPAYSGQNPVAYTPSSHPNGEYQRASISNIVGSITQPTNDVAAAHSSTGHGHTARQSNSAWLRQGESLQQQATQSQHHSHSNLQVSAPISASQATLSNANDRTRFAPRQPVQNYDASYSSHQNAPLPETTSSFRPSYGTAFQPPQRYQSPQHAVEALQSNQNIHRPQYHNEAIRSNSPQVSDSVASSGQSGQNRRIVSGRESTTVNPSFVYDNRMEVQRQAQMEAEKRRRVMEERTAKKAEEERVEVEARARAEVEKAASAKTMAQSKRKANEASKRSRLPGAPQANEHTAKAGGRQRKSGSNTTALQQLASSALEDVAPPQVSSSKDDQLERMRAMIKAMREASASNPEMFAKLIEEDKRSSGGSQALVALQTGNTAPVSPRALVPPPPAPVMGRQSVSASPHLSAPTVASSAKSRERDPTPAAQARRTSNSSAKQTPAAFSYNASEVPAIKQMSSSRVSSEERKQVAAKIAHWLQDQPQNAAIVVSEEIVLRMLQSNPSYAQLCALLEKSGLRFDRQALARELMKAFSDRNGSSKPDANQQTSGSPANRPASLQQESISQRNQKNLAPPMSYLSTSAAGPRQRGEHLGSGHGSHDSPAQIAAEANEMHKVGTESGPLSTETRDPSAAPIHAPRSESQNNARTSAQPISETKPEPIVAQPVRPPANKEEAARKRTFGDLVDLTADDSEDDLPPTKRFLPSSGARPETSTVSYTPRAEPSRPMQIEQQMALGYAGSRADSWRHHAHHMGMLRNPMMWGEHTAMPPTMLHANQMFLQSQQRQYLQQHPHAHQHLQQQQQQQKEQQQRQPAADKPKPKGPTQEQLQISRMRGKMLVEPIMRDRVARKSHYDSRTIARDVLLATGRHPDLRGLNSHLAPMAKLLADHGGQVDNEGRNNLKCDLATIKWDLIDPGGPKTNEQTISEDIVESKETQAVVESPSRNNDDISSAIVTPNTRQKRGRPRKSSLTNHLGDSAATLPASTQEQHSSETISSGTGNANATMSGATGYAAFGQRDASGAKKKGRPFGWRKNIHSRAAQGLSTTSNPASNPTTPSQVVPQYQVYQCRWSNCRAKLHNLDTIMKHVHKIHSVLNDREEYECKWAECDEHAFSSLADWQEHVDSTHLRQVAWRLGDGPRGGSVRESKHDSDGYLADARGRSTTPVISPPEPTTGPKQRLLEITGNKIKWPSRAGRPRADSDERDAVDDLQELEKHKAAVGPVLDRQGCILASEDRRLTFLEDEDFEDEVDESEHDWLDSHDEFRI